MKCNIVYMLSSARQVPPYTIIHIPRISSIVSHKSISDERARPNVRVAHINRAGGALLRRCAAYREGTTLAKPAGILKPDIGTVHTLRAGRTIGITRTTAGVRSYAAVTAGKLRGSKASHVAVHTRGTGCT